MFSEFHGYLITVYSYLDSQCNMPFNRQVGVFRSVMYNIARIYENLCPVVLGIYNLGWNFSNDQALVVGNISVISKLIRYRLLEQ